MADLINLKTIRESKGCLTGIENCLPFEVKRVYYIHGVDNSVRGKHRHKSTIQAAICINGSCTINNNNGKTQMTYLLNDRSKCLILYPEDFHTMFDFSNDAILLVLASHNYDPTDYIYDPY